MSFPPSLWLDLVLLPSFISLYRRITKCDVVFPWRNITHLSHAFFRRLNKKGTKKKKKTAGNGHYVPRQHSFHAVFLVKVPATCCCPKRQKVIYDKCPRHVSPPPYFRLQKLFQTEICWRSLSPDCDTSAQFTFLSSITGWVQPHRLPFYSHTKKKRAKNRARSQTQSWHTASVETETLRGDSSAATCSTRESPKALLLWQNMEQ